VFILGALELTRSINNMAFANDDQCKEFTTDLKALIDNLMFARRKYKSFSEAEWSGGSLHDGGEGVSAVPDSRLKEAIRNIEQAVKHVEKAEHLVTLYRIVGEE
jgi:hypothetical protein